MENPLQVFQFPPNFPLIYFPFCTTKNWKVGFGDTQNPPSNGIQVQKMGGIDSFPKSAKSMQFVKIKVI